MKTKKLLIGLFILLFFACIVCFCACNSNKENEDGTTSGLQYEEYSGSCAVVGYVGDEAEITIPKKHNGKKVTSIANGAFKCNDIVEKVDLPESVAYIGQEAFAYCTSLYSINTCDVYTIMPFAFYSCTALESVAFRYTVYIGDYAFYNCSSLCSVVWSGNSYQLPILAGTHVFGYDSDLMEKYCG